MNSYGYFQGCACRKRLIHCLLGALFAILASANPVPAQSSLTTTFTGGDSGGIGWTVYSDLSVTNPVIINAFDVNVTANAGTTFSIDVYVTAPVIAYGEGQYFSAIFNWSNPGVWTHVASGAGTAAGSGLASNVVTNSFSLNPGVYGFAVRYTGTGMNIGDGGQVFSNSDLEIDTGSIALTLAYPFCPCQLNPGAIWNGTIYYTLGDSSTLGACCSNFTGACWLNTASGCGSGSTFQGVGAPCQPINPCPQPSAPANDNCATADDLNTRTFPYSPIVVNTAASPDVYSVPCNCCPAASSLGYGVWYKFDAPAAGGTMLFSDPTVAANLWAVYATSGTCPDPSLTPVYCNPPPIVKSTQALMLTPGTRYYFLEGQPTPVASAPTSPLTPTFTYLPPPNNQTCSTASVLVSPSLFSVSNLGATGPMPNDPTACVSTPVYNDVWYEWTATASGSIALAPRGTPEPGYALHNGGILVVYDAGPSPGTCPTSNNAGLLACNVFSGPNVTAVVPSASVTAGHVYYFQVGSLVQNDTGTAVFDFDFAPGAIGACCSSNGCTMQTSGECSAAGGTYDGNGTACSVATATISSYTGAGGALPSGVLGFAEGVFTSSITVPDAFTVADVQVDLNGLNEDRQGNLIISLNNGTRTVFLTNRGRRGASNAGATNAAFVNSNTYSWSDAGTQSVFSAVSNSSLTTLPSGVYTSGGVLGLTRGFAQTFNGLSAAGTWTLKIENHGSEFVSSNALTSWTLHLKQGTGGPCPSSGICCKGSTCSTGVPSASCTGADTIFVSGSGACNASSNRKSPCCEADFNHVGGITVQDIFDFLAAWFAKNPIANITANGTGAPTVQSIFDFLAAWFAKGC